MRSLSKNEKEGVKVNTAIRNVQSQLSGSEPVSGNVDFSGDVSFTGTATFANTGLHILDTNATHDLIVAPGSNLTADRTLTVTTGDANRTLTITADSSIGGTAYVSGGTDVALADGGTGASLVDPNADRILFWDDSAGAVTFLAPNTAITISGTNLNVSVAAQADQETGTSNTVVVTPGVQHFHQSAAKAWGIITGGGTPALAAGYNVATVTDSGAGIVTVDLTTGFSSTSYVVVASLLSGGSVLTNLGVKVAITDANTFTLTAEIADGTDTDPSVGFSFVCYGDMA